MDNPSGNSISLSAYNTLPQHKVHFTLPHNFVPINGELELLEKK